MGHRYDTFDWYEDVLYYDIVFDEDTAEEADFIEHALAKHGTSGGRQILEPACGSGRLVDAMVARGYSVTGFDLSEGSVNFAKERLRKSGRKAAVHRMNMADFTFTKKFDLAHCFVSTFKLLTNPDDALAHLRCVANALKPGGIYLLGLHITDYDDTGACHERWVGERDGVHVVCNIRAWEPNRRTRTEEVRSRLVITEPGQPRPKRLETRWTFRTYSPRQLKMLLSQVPELTHIATYDFGYDIDSPTELNDDQYDYILVLQRTPDRPS